MNCPCCRQTVDHINRLMVDLDGDWIVYRGEKVDCRPPQITETIFALADRWPRMATHGEIADALWGHDAAEHKRESIAVYACLARKALRPFGIGVEATHRRGYRLLYP
jgi:hypothetical protein